MQAAIYILAAFGAWRAARQLRIYARIAKVVHGIRATTPVEWLRRNDFTPYDDGQVWTRGPLAVRRGRHGWFVEWAGALQSSCSDHPGSAVLNYLYAQADGAREMLWRLR